MKKIAVTIFLSMIICRALYAFPIGFEKLEKLEFSGTGHSRWAYTDWTVPYHAANVLDIFGRYNNPDRTLQIDTRFTFENPSASDEYMTRQQLFGRMSVSYRKEFAKFASFNIKAGDLGKVTYGRGLTIKDMHAMGFIAGFTTSDISGSLTYIGRGYSDYGDYALFDIEPTQAFFPLKVGATCFFTIMEDDQISSSLLGGYADIPVGGGVTISVEAAMNVSKSPFNGTPAALLIKPYTTIVSSTRRLSLSVTGRYHTSAFNSVLNNPVPKSTFHALEDEDDEVDNWRNALLNTYDYPSNLLSGAVHLKWDESLGNDLWAVLDSEWIVQKYVRDTTHNWFYKAGLSYEWAPNQTIYTIIQNKVFSNSGGENYLQYAPTFTQVDSFWVLGLRYQF
jgi:hypothetical protein